MPPTLRLWGGLRLPSAFGSDHTACEHSESIFSALFICLFRSKVGRASLAELKECELVRRRSFFDPEGQVPADVSRTAFLSDGSAWRQKWQVCSPGGSRCAAKGDVRLIGR